MKHYFKILFLILGIVVSTFSCQKQDEIISDINQYQVPSIETARTYFNDRANLGNLDINYSFRNGESTLNSDWERSKAKKYKDEPQENIDILYTPIYLPTSGNAKGFIGTVEINGELQSKIIMLIYTESSNDNAFSGFMLLYDLDGNIEYSYKYSEGQRIAEGLPSLGTTNANRNNGDDCNNPFDSVGCFIDWIGGDWFGIDGFIENEEVVVIAAGDSSTGGYVNDSDFGNPGFNIPMLNDPYSGTATPWWLSNTVSPNAVSIVMALELEHASLPEAQWLLNEANQEQLESIASFLNDNRVIDRDTVPSEFENDGVDQNQVTEISQEALDFALTMINSLINNPSVSYEYSPSNQSNNNFQDFDSFSEVEDFYQNATTSSSSTFSTDRDKFTHSFNLWIFSYAIHMDIEKLIPNGNSCDCIEVVDVITYLSGNETLVAYEQIGDYWTDISSQENTIKVSVKGKITHGLNIYGFPWKRSEIYVMHVTYNHSTGLITNYGINLY
ncbi:hypothetical protein [Psychroserpens sp. SPM9]|uniref:hypothetical protein n=1 Tax=Psychroserpens sp. SPM9 TaxID=2975598 RepID=UPI0021A71E89|nr:hypothetical protein [Psychroserpens sp. SPM9]MDG5490442.1 hypothetical protein [Psychroserpens sp. SPM9]